MSKVKRSLRKLSYYVSFALIVLASEPSQAQKKSLPAMRSLPKSTKSFSYDVSGSSGVNNGSTYSEINLGLNWFLTDWLNWRNSIFSRFGSTIKSVQGLDSSVLASWDAFSEDKTLGFQAYIGPGVRVASDSNNAATADAGVILTLAGIKLGVGAKALQYFSTRSDSLGNTLGKNETQYYIVLAGGGGF